MKKVFFLISFIFLAGIHRGEASGGIVYDPTSFAQQAIVLEQVTAQVAKATEQINKLNDKLQQMKAQVEQGERHSKDRTGKRDHS